ncbi:putative aryl-alcohol dehydrogenase aad14 [Microbotryomycetes sp. JL201]|nr:putative aryl-alcohol dehydrogenase aad14 [Microbotryomycetes sp. JL201]
MSIFELNPEPKTPLGRHRILSPTAGVRVSPLVLGGMSMGEAWSEFMGKPTVQSVALLLTDSFLSIGAMNKEQTFKLLDAFVEAGGNFIDTSSNYQDEQSELFIGEWLRERKLRDRIVLATKYSTNYRQYADGKNETVNYGGNHKKALHLSIRDSLNKLQTDYIDILYIHWWDYTTSIEEVMNALHILVEQGKVLYLGASDTPAWVVSAANTYAKAHGKTPFSVYQGRWNVMLRDFERDIIPLARYFGMALTCWDVLGGGRLQSKKQASFILWICGYIPDRRCEQLEARKASGEKLRTIHGGPEQTEDEVKYSEVLEQIAQEHGVESLTAVCLAYVTRKTPYVFPIVGGRKVEHLHDNIKALSIKLTPEQIKRIESVKPFDMGFPHSFIGTDVSIEGKSGHFLINSGGWIDFLKGPQPL